MTLASGLFGLNQHRLVCRHCLSRYACHVAEQMLQALNGAFKCQN